MKKHSQSEPGRDDIQGDKRSDCGNKPSGNQSGNSNKRNFSKIPEDDDSDIHNIDRITNKKFKKDDQEE